MFFIVFDSLIVLTAIYTSHFILNIQSSYSPFLLLMSVSLLIFHHLFSWIHKLYKRVWAYASISELMAIINSVTFSIGFVGLIQFIFYQDIYFRILFVTWMLHMMLIAGTRFVWRLYRMDLKERVNKKGNRTLIIGAGSTGTMIVRQLVGKNDSKLNPVAFIDDDMQKHLLHVMGIPVVGGIEKIEQTVNKMNIENIVIAIPSISKKKLNDIFRECSKTDAKTQILPKIEDLMMGKVAVNQFRDIKIEDLLGRAPVKFDDHNLLQSIQNQTILVTGAGGSIGSELCRQISNYEPTKVILLGHGENSIYLIEQELTNKHANIEYITEIADIQDKEKIKYIMQKHKPNIVYHAAAHKHVPLMERNPEEAVKNNIIGTKNVVEVADEANVDTFVMISTDKAVNPTSVMGATKRIAEMIVQYMDKISKTRFVAVRFGNVLGSRGSVIPVFEKQIQAGGPVTVTHPEMERYFMTIPEASRLVVQAGTLAKGGEVFILDMGNPIKIKDLAKNLIKLSGYSEEEIKIKYTGIRPGEKLFEELLDKSEVQEKKVSNKIYVGKSNVHNIDQINYFIHIFDSINKEELRGKILNMASSNSMSRTIKERVL
nr:nucleoside-diphosphate sugar epimerase/dehydratase [Chengkuizengella sediminis]